jgi:hypothetical protein
MSHESHTRISRPTFLVSVPDHVFEVRVWLFSEESLNEIARLVSGEPEEHPDTIDISCVQSDRMSGLGLPITELQEVVGALRWASNFAGTLETKQKEVKNKAIVLEDERRELEATNHTVTVNVVHVLICELNIVL